MIARLKGALVSRNSNKLVLDVAGVGYEVTVSASTYRKLPPEGSAVELLIYTAVRENDISLFGFLEAAEKQVFEKLLLVSGIGPKLAITVLSGIAPYELAASVHREDLVRLTAIPGIGRRTAERMIVDLKDKLIGFASSAAESRGGSRTAPTTSERNFEDLLSALTNLGYTRAIAEKTLARLSLEKLSLKDGLKEALKILSK